VRRRRLQQGRWVRLLPPGCLKQVPVVPVAGQRKLRSRLAAVVFLRRYGR
jgi:hypothetical protein